MEKSSAKSATDLLAITAVCEWKFNKLFEAIKAGIITQNIVDIESLKAQTEDAATYFAEMANTIWEFDQDNDDAETPPT